MANKIHPITVDLPVETWELLSKAAKQDGRKVAWLAKKIITDAVSKHSEKGGD